MPRHLTTAWATHTLQFDAHAQPSGNRYWQCRYCLQTFTSSLTRLLRHCSGIGGKGIGACCSVPSHIAQGIIQEHPREFSDVAQPIVREHPIPPELASTDAPIPTTASPELSKGKRRASDDASAPTPQVRPFASSSYSGAAGGSTSTSSLRQQTLSFTRQRQREADIEIGRCFIECNLSFNIARTERWKKMVQAIGRAGYSDTWTGPDYRSLRTTIIDDEIARISSALQPVRESWSTFGCTILSDGWTDVRRRHIINILVSSCLGTYFLRAVDAGQAGQAITAEFIYGHIRAAIIDVGVENVVQVVTDNASNCRRMGELLEQEFPSIVWTPCAAHCLDLLMEDIGRLPWIRETLDIV